MPAIRIQCSYCNKKFWAARRDSKWCSQKCRADSRQEDARFNIPEIPSSGVPGITYNRRLSRWTIKIKIDNDWKYVGTKQTIQEALTYAREFSIPETTTLH